ncbi:hypothetical protein MAP00_004912 [Monascus purpureus]|nr:hypothetical protein MAP00_004912 [Monascus purpureus]
MTLSTSTVSHSVFNSEPREHSTFDSLRLRVLERALYFHRLIASPEPLLDDFLRRRMIPSPFPRHRYLHLHIQFRPFPLSCLLLGVLETAVRPTRPSNIPVNNNSANLAVFLERK